MANPAAGAVNLGSAYGEVLIDFSNVERQLNTAFANAERSISGFMNRTGQSLQRIGAGITVATLPIAGFVKQGISAFANFEEVLAEIEARTGATAEQMKIVEQTALDMGKATAFSAKESAEAMLQLLAAGLDTTQAIAALKPTLDLAAAGKLGLAEAASVVTTVLGQFQLGADQAGRVADALARASAASRAEISDLGQAFGNVGPIANRFGLSVEQTAAILAQFANNGIMGAEAGTQLKSMLTNLTRPTEDVQEMWRKLGISLYDAQGNIRPLNTVIQELNRRMATMTEQDRNEAIITLAGSYGQMGLEILLASNGIDTMTASMERQAGAAKVASGWFGTLKGKAESFLGSLETVMIRIFKPLANNILKPLIDRGTEFLNWVSDLLEKNPMLAYTFGIILGLLVLLGPTLIAVGTAVQFLGFAMAGVTGIMGIMSGAALPLIGILLALAAVVATLVLAYRSNLFGFRNFVDGFVADVGKIIGTVTGFIARIREVGLSQALDEFYKSGGRFQKTGRGVVRGILDIIGAIAGFIKLVRKNGFVAALQQVFTTLEDGSSWIGNILQSFGMAQARAEGIGNSINRVVQIAMRAVGAVMAFGRGLANAFQSGGFGGVLDYLRNLAQIALPIVIGALNTLIAGVIGWLGTEGPTLANGFGQLIGVGLRFLADKIIEYGPTVVLAIAGLWLAIQEWVLTVGLPNIAGLAILLAGNFIAGVADGFGDINWGEVWTTVWNAAKQAAGVALALLWQASVWVREKLMVPMFNYLREIDWGEVWTTVWNAAKKAAGLTLALLWQASVWVREKLMKPMFDYLRGINWGEVWTTVWNAAKHAAGLALALLWNFSQWTREKILMPIWNYIKSIDWTQIATDLWNGLKNGMSDVWESLDIGGFFKGLGQKALDSLKEPFDFGSPSRTMYDLGMYIVQGLQNGINDNAQGAVQAALNMANQINAQVQGAQAQISALNALAAQASSGGLNRGLAGIGASGTGGGNTTNNQTNWGGLNVILPAGSIPRTNNPQQQGKGIGIGLQRSLVRRGLGTRRP